MSLREAREKAEAWRRNYKELPPMPICLVNQPADHSSRRELRPASRPNIGEAQPSEIVGLLMGAWTGAI